MTSWTSQSSAGKQIAVSIACSLVGLVLALACRDFRTAGGDATAGFLLGVLLLVIGVAGLVTSGRQTVVVDPALRRIKVDDSNFLGEKTRVIAFSEVTQVSVGYLGKRSNFVTWYYLALTLRSGEKYSLFSPGRFFKGASDRATVEGWRKRLEGYVGLRGARPGALGGAGSAAGSGARDA